MIGKSKIVIPCFYSSQVKARNKILDSKSSNSWTSRSRNVAKSSKGSFKNKTQKKNFATSNRFEPQGFKTRSQHQYEGSKSSWDNDSVSIDMESYLSYSI